MASEQMVAKHPGSSDEHRPRVLLLLTATTYRAPAFIAAAERAGVDVVTATDMSTQLAEYWHQTLGLPFADVEGATAVIVAYAREQPLDAIIAVDDSGSLLAATASQALGLPHTPPEAAEAARDKYVMRQMLARANVPSPPFRLWTANDDPAAIAAATDYPCVVKPRLLSGSRGVMRADNPAECVAAIERLIRLLQNLDPHDPDPTFLIEEFIPGFEVALEGLLDAGQLRVLALFDKPDPLDGPFFEETLYVTPSRLPEPVQRQIEECAAAAAAALGLRDGPLHAELRVNHRGAWIVELAGRSIGGLCSQTLRFGTDMSLEELIIRQACRREVPALQSEQSAGGVMMIPIPRDGILTCVSGIEQARAVRGIEDVQITAKLHYPLVPLPEGDSYLGFIFAHGSEPDGVETALREAHRHLHFEIKPHIPLVLT